MDYPTFVAFYYDANPKHPLYAAGAQRLAAQCKTLGIPLKIVAADLSRYIREYTARNPRTVTARRVIYRYIPIFIEQQLRVQNSPILYLHCDSYIIRRPPLEAFTPDMVVGYSHNPGNSNTYGAFASPLFFKPGRTSSEFLGLWRTKCQNIDSDQSEHVFLGLTIRDFIGCPEVCPFSEQVSSERKTDNPCILYGQGLTKTGGIA
jgi:hypothetical protein